MFIATLFTTAKTGKQTKHPSTEEQKEKMKYIYTVEYYSAIKRYEFESVVVRWMNLEPIIQSEVSQRENQILYINAYIWNLEKWS